jgi:hypothetical protein
MKQLLFALALFPVFAPAAALAAGKCINAAGKVTYTDLGCPDGSHGTRFRSEKKAIPAVSEELECAARWLKDEGEWQRLSGPDGAGRAVRSSFSFTRCGKYGYSRPTDLSRFSAGRWTAMRSACGLLQPQASAVKQVPAGLDLGQLRGDCERFRTFATPQDLEKSLRAERDTLDLKR